MGNTRQHMSACPVTVSSWVKKVLGIVKAYMSPGTLCGTGSFGG